MKYMHLCQQNKADKGGYDGRALPPGLAVKGKKQDQEIVIYEPWAKELRKLALRAQALSWNMGKLNREVARKVFLFPEISEEDKARYLFKTMVGLSSCRQRLTGRLSYPWMSTDPNGTTMDTAGSPTAWW